MLRVSMLALAALFAVVSLKACSAEKQAPAAAPTIAAAPAAIAPAPTVESAPSDPAPNTPAEPAAAPERLSALPADKPVADGRWQAGTNYATIVPAQPTNVGAGKVEVLEVFWYGCNHCYALDPALESWRKNKPSYIDFVRVPVMWGPVHKQHARLFYAIQALNRPDIHAKAFDSIHRAGQMLAGQTDAEARNIHAAFMKANGVSAKDFADAYDSMSVSLNLQRAEDATRRYRVAAVPIMVVNGKYQTGVGEAGGHSQLIALINDLAAKEKR